MKGFSISVCLLVTTPSLNKYKVVEWILEWEKKYTPIYLSNRPSSRDRTSDLKIAVSCYSLALFQLSYRRHISRWCRRYTATTTVTSDIRTHVSFQDWLCVIAGPHLSPGANRGTICYSDLHVMMTHIVATGPLYKA